MSRAFIKNDAGTDQAVVPRRAPLPPGATNYVTPRGIAMLKEELAGLEAERARLVNSGGSDDADRTIRAASLAQRIGEIIGRIESAEVVDPACQPRDKVRFGTTATVRTISGVLPGEVRRLTIVGVDEADPAAGLVSFLSPIASALIGLRVGETVSLRTAKGEEDLEILDIG